MSSTFYLQINSLTGVLPTQVGLVGMAHYFSLFSNALTGPMPTQLGTLSAMTNAFQLFANSLTGKIPLAFAVRRDPAAAAAGCRIRSVIAAAGYGWARGS